MPDWKTAKEHGYANNKDVIFDRLDSIYIEKFRSMEDRELRLGKNITLIAGKNGTMKSSLLGMIAHSECSMSTINCAFY
ncbi:AAA family ATPase [Alkalibacter mobilis]|uniref:AAA family ATPase n=1 Tax=Alkalibacter mobilis TaxID=2787712 RepID=UPI00189CD24B|nr:AAA family ATPase [Alkalibacter mobilis]MBF7097608.1 AAA family ATPase [Alkalibacter mobilis]